MKESIPAIWFSVAMIAMFLLGLAALLMPIFVIVIASRLANANASLRRLESLLSRQSSASPSAIQNPIALRKK